MMPSPRFIPAASILALLAGLAPTAGAGPLVMNSPTSAWTAVLYPGTQPDYSNDQGSPGQTESDIVGNLAHPSFYTAFDDAGTAALTDGMLGFRIRLGADKGPAGFDKTAAVGIDANGDGAIDLFALVDNSANQIALYNPGAGANNSPITTSITATGLSYSETSSNYNWSAVTVTIDPTATIFDINGDGSTDRFLSFAVPLQDIVNRLALRGITGVDQNTSFRYMVGTSTNASTLNQDIAGPNGGTSSAVTWVGLGAVSNPITAGGVTPVPEPGTASLLGLGLLALARLRRRR